METANGNVTYHSQLPFAPEFIERKTQLHQISHLRGGDPSNRPGANVTHEQCGQISHDYTEMRALPGFTIE